MNTNWNDVLSVYLELSGDESTLSEIKLDGATPEQLVECETKIGMKLPTELRDFYSYSNGLALEDDRTKEPRFLRQIQKLPAYVKFARESFAETHQKYARRYLPFIDWENGDSSGYLLDATGAYRPEIFIFLHEHYEYIEEQDINEFLQPFAESLANFFTQS